MLNNIYIVIIWWLGSLSIYISAQQRTFTVNHERNTFQLNGEDFQYISGSFHYFRAVPSQWRARIKTMKLAGLNVLDTYIEWAFHVPRDGIYNFEGMANITHFLDIAEAEGFLIIIRPGPFICAERDNGGIPYWLFNKYPNIKLRTSDPDYLREVNIWYEKLMPQLEQYMYGNGGPIIMVQVENEYSSFACDRVYMNWLSSETDKYVQSKALLFTVDIPTTVEQMRCGTADGVFATTDFGIEVGERDMETVWAKIREIQPTGPLVNSEFYPGWLTHWEHTNMRRDADRAVKVLKKMLADGANVNIYMFFGGTNFGFTAGANIRIVGGYLGEYAADITSYDYDAVMDEAGDPNECGFKYHKFQEAITEFFNITPIAVSRARKMSLPPVRMNPKGCLLSAKARAHLAKDDYDGTTKIFSAQRPLSFEQMNQFSGFVLYETELPILELDPTVILVDSLHDRALVYVDQEYVGCLSRENNVSSLAIVPGLGSRLQILVENQGRINFEVANDYKGILGAVSISQRNGVPLELTGWTMTGFPLTNYNHLKQFLDDSNLGTVFISKNGRLTEGPLIFHSQFELTTDEIYDTYLDSSGWGKGIAYINGFHLGRYWPTVGPQITMYVPGDILLKGRNEIVIIELERLSPKNNFYVHFASEAVLDGSPDGNIGRNDGSNSIVTTKTNKLFCFSLSTFRLTTNGL